VVCILYILAFNMQIQKMLAHLNF